VNISSHCEWINMSKPLCNVVLRKSCKVDITRFGHTLCIKYGNFYSIFFNGRPIIIHHVKINTKLIGWNLLSLAHLWYSPLCYIVHNLEVCQIWTNVKQGDTNHSSNLLNFFF
jgi:hypothetical protein